MSVLSAILFALTCCGVLYYVLSTLALARHFHPPSPNTHPPTPKISILKPVCGVDADLRNNLLTFLTQDYPKYEVLFGVLDANDPAVAIIEELVAGYPHSSLHIGATIEGANNKVRILHNLATHTNGDIVVIADADTRATPDFLRRITSPFSDSTVGVVTCLYKGIGGSTVAEGLHALHMTCIFAPGVAAANSISGIDFGLGAAIAVRKTALEAIGGFAPIANYLADDFQLGRRVAQSGAKVALSDYVIDIVLDNENIASALTRELRWSRTTKASRPLGHAGLVFTFGFAYALLLLMVSPLSALAWIVFTSTLAIRIVTAYVGAAFSMGDRNFTGRAHLLPLRDLLSFGIWIAGYFSRTVTWRGRKLRLIKGGKVAYLE